MFEMMRELLATSYAPHGYCLLWQPWLIWTHAVSDALIALAYFSIPIALIVFVRKRRDIAFGGVFWLFALFITACGATHILSIWNLWHGDYGAEALVKVITAIASVFTAVLLWPLLPKAIALPSPGRLREANEALSVRIAERDAAMVALRAEIVEREKAEAALLQSRKMEAIGQLTGGIAHDFNNLLQVVGGSLSLIETRTSGDAKLEKLTASAQNAIDRAKRLTGQLLAFSRLQRLELKVIEIPSLIGDVKELLARTIDPSIVMTFTGDENPYNVVADRVQLELAILNLALNARDAMPDGGRLTIGIGNHRFVDQDDVEDGDYLAIGVTDTGTGMSPDIVQRAFEPFFTTKAVGHGSGLGLSMVFGMTRQSGGTVTIASEPGVGTAVTIYLRRADEAALPVGGRSRPDPRKIARLTGYTVLVVDDEPEVRDVIVAMLNEFGCTVMEANHGQHAMEVVEQQQPDVMIVDFAMPGMNGADLARKLLSRWPDIRVVFATGYSRSEAIDAVMGVDAVVLRKPFSHADLVDALNQALT